jgi:hypothetical protein
VAQPWATAQVSSSPSLMPAMTATAAATYVDLTERSLIHSAVNAADVLASTHVPSHAPRLPSLAQAGLDLATYLVAALGLGTWRWSRDP